MFYYRDGLKHTHSEKASEIQEANRVIQESIEENLKKVVEQLKKSDIPAEEHDGIIKDIRKKAQVKMLAIFNEKVKENSKPVQP